MNHGSILFRQLSCSRQQPYQNILLRTFSGSGACGVGVMNSYNGPFASLDGISSTVCKAEYAVRGPLVIRADEIENEINSSTKKFPFEKLVRCNIGNPQALKQKPITFIREVIAGTICPNEMILSSISKDAAERCATILEDIGSMGAYSHSKGVPAIRKRIAKALQVRDDAPCDAECLFLTNGASEGVKVILTMLIRSSQDGVLIPIPQYPLYSATMTLLGGKQVDYFLNESNSWELDLDQLEANLNKARQDGVNVRAIVVINPGNPTGQTLTRKNMEELVKFCELHNLMILADEVYQVNVYEPTKPFVSFKKVIYEMKSPVQLASFHSISKGVIGECGLRGGFLEVHNLPKQSVDMVYKMMSISLCANLPGQVAVDVMMTPPSVSDPSYEKYVDESSEILQSLKRRAVKLGNALNKFEGVECNLAQGAMYLFPRISIPPRAVEFAKRQGVAPDAFYCMQLLEETGIVVVPGSGFGQVEGTWHFRTTILPPEDEIDQVVEKMGEFHDNFLRRFT